MGVSLKIGGVRLEGRLRGTPPALGGLAQTDLLEIGDLAHWEPGNALCPFFGPTPASRGPQPKAASPVFPVGHVEGDWFAVKALGPEVRLLLSGAG